MYAKDREIKKGLATLLRRQLQIIASAKREGKTGESLYNHTSPYFDMINVAKKINLSGKEENLFSEKELQNFNKKYLEAIQYHKPIVGNILR